MTDHSLGSRTRRGHLETAIRRYRHPATGHEVIAVGTIHVGEQDYFDRLRARVDQLDTSGWEVQYELITPAVRTDITDEEHARLTTLRGLSKTSKWLADLLALPMQHQWFPLPEHWHNTDVCDLDIVRACEDLSMLDTARERVEKMDLSDPRSERLARWLFIKLFQNLPRVMRLVDWLKDAGKIEDTQAQRVFDEYIIDHRNALAVDAAIAESRPVVTVWGAGHLPGMDARLRMYHGYECAAVEWERAL